MSSKINTGTLNVNYPLPGVNNSSQGLRDNFTSIKTNLDATKLELEEILSKALFKNPITGSALTNDLNNNIISNVQTMGFRSSTYNLGSNLVGPVKVDLTYGDVQYGDMTGNITLEFAKWSPNQTYSSVRLILNVSAGQIINLPITATTGVIYGTSTIEGFDSVSGNIIIPNGVTRVHFQFNSIDCGTTIEIVAIDRPRIAQQVKIGIPVTDNVLATGTITFSSSSISVTGAGTLFTTELLVGQKLYTSSDVLIGTVSAISNDTSLTLSSVPNITFTNSPYARELPVGSVGDTNGSVKVDSSFMYVCTSTYTAPGQTAIWKRIPLGAY